MLVHGHYLAFGTSLKPFPTDTIQGAIESIGKIEVSIYVVFGTGALDIIYYSYRVPCMPLFTAFASR
ncbi:hypothetical protein ACFL1J_07825 [Pseudomonadota bacterium]